MRRHHSRIAISALTIVALTSCWNPFAPTEGALEGVASLILTERRNPDEVLQNFRYAYIYRDSVAYSRLFDTSFVFLYDDPDIGGGAGGYNYWGLDTELRTTGALFRRFDHFTLVWNATTGRDTSQSGEISLTKTFDLSVGGVKPLTGNAIFDFREDSTNNIWLITRWQDNSF